MYWQITAVKTARVAFHPMGKYGELSGSRTLLVKFSITAIKLAIASYGECRSPYAVTSFRNQLFW
jgi:hypothetical protein